MQIRKQNLKQISKFNHVFEKKNIREKKTEKQHLYFKLNQKWCNVHG